MSIAIDPSKPRVILIGLTLPDTNPSTTKDHLEELAALAHTRNMKVWATFSQKLPKPIAATWIGKGKTEEIASYIKEHQITHVIFDHELTPGQMRNLQKILKCTIWDRSFLILEIFAAQARTAQAQTQVKLAQYQYLLPRLTGMWTHHSRQRGGVNMRGPGEKELETDRRIIREKIHLLKSELKQIEKQTRTASKQRTKAVRVALVGYTNAGKSSLMQALTKKEAYIKDKLFATLTTTIRKIEMQKIPFLLSDTVGFIRKLPHTLIKAFTSTLMEVREADILLHVIDISHKKHLEHIDVVEKTLSDIGAGQIPTLLVLNKSDLLHSIKEDRVQYLENIRMKITNQYKKKSVILSVSKKENFDQLEESLRPLIHKRYLDIYPHSLQKK